MTNRDSVVRWEELRRVCNPSVFPHETTEGIEPLEDVLGQERAVRSIEFGLDISSSGFNLFLAGQHGTGRTNVLMRVLKRIAADRPTPDDVLWVHNFDGPDKPRVLRLPAGAGARFASEVRELIDDVREQLARAFESKEYADAERQGSERSQSRKEELLEELRAAAREKSVDIRPTPTGFQSIALRDGKPVTELAYKSLTDEERKTLQKSLEEAQSAIREFLVAAKSIDREEKDALRALDLQIARDVLEQLFHEIVERYREHPSVLEHLERVRGDIVDRAQDFRRTEPEGPTIPGLVVGHEGPDTTRYQVNLAVDNSGVAGAPVVVESNPTYGNLVGRIERKTQFGSLVTDFTLIRAGALARANGGYLVLDVEDLLSSPFAYQALKHALKDREIAIEELSERLGFLTSKSLRPEPIPLDLKVCLIGKSQYYHLLYAFDEDFRECFKVKADFDHQMPRDEEAILRFGRFVARLVLDEKLLHFDRAALAALVDESSRIVEDREKLSLAFGQMNDLIREIVYWARKDGATVVSAPHVRTAIEEREYRSSLARDRVQEMIHRDVLMISTAEAVVGQINGLAVHLLGDYLFGRPTRITASVRVGADGVVNIERKVQLSQSSHDKGVLILSAFLGERFAQDAPIALSASIAFEQSYAEVSGDSASVAELYALLSALADVPIRQGIAVTGSVNQKGEVQPIGGVNHKIEGFFDTCLARGLTGDQGVIIPERNLQHLMVREDVVDAVREGRFHVWSIRHVDEGARLLTGLEPGELDDEGAWTPGSLNELVAARLQGLLEGLQTDAQLALRDGPEIILPAQLPRFPEMPPPPRPPSGPRG